MEEIGLLILIYLSNLFTAKHINDKYKEKIKEYYDNTIKDLDTSCKIIKHNKLELKKETNLLLDLIPFINVLISLDRYLHLDRDYKKQHADLIDVCPKLYLEDVNEQKKQVKEQKVLVKKNYFIGKIINGKAKNIYFSFDGYDINIKEDSNFANMLKDEEKIEILFEMLYLLYSGYGHELNHSNNINEVFTPGIIKCLEYRFNQEEQCLALEDVVVRKRKLEN